MVRPARTHPPAPSLTPDKNIRGQAPRRGVKVPLFVREGLRVSYFRLARCKIPRTPQYTKLRKIGKKYRNVQHSKMKRALSAAADRNDTFVVVTSAIRNRKLAIVLTPQSPPPPISHS